jgi:hypothetical protein
VVLLWLIVFIRKRFLKYNRDLEERVAKSVLDTLPKTVQERANSVLEDEANYRYQAKRYGIGYSSFDVQCAINLDGSASVIREVELEAYSEIKELDTFIRIPEKDPEGSLREIEVGKIEANNQRTLKLEVVDDKPGNMSAKILFSPRLKFGDTEKYTIYDYYLPKGLFAIGLSSDEIKKRESKFDYFGWHINRPTKNFILQVHFPPDIKPIDYDIEVKYALSAGVQSDLTQHEEQGRLKKVERKRSANRYVLRLDVDYPIIGLIYILRWKPVPKN